MKNTPEENIAITIAAAGRPLGRVAAEAAHVLMGKHKAAHAPNRLAPLTLDITGVASLVVAEKKKEQKTYVRYSGYPGGLKKENMHTVLDKKGMREVLRKAIYGMLPPNKLRALRMKQITFTD